MISNQSEQDVAIFGAGCFWGVEESFRTVTGVVATSVGFMGGNTTNPTYKEVCVGDTGHVEVVKITYIPKVISYEELLEIFWKIHDPTQIDRQGPDHGSQYRSVIFYKTDSQREQAIASREALEASHRYIDPIATEIEKSGEFYEAEEYHQKYLSKKGVNVCH